jgi:signal transduction histidine kinase
VAFDDSLRVYLELLERLGYTGIPAAPVRQIDEHELHRHLLQRLRDLSTTRAPEVTTVVFEAWSTKLPALARFLEALPSQIAPVDRGAGESFARRVLDAAIGTLDSHVELVDRLELQRVVKTFSRGDANVEGYALENRLVHHDQSRRTRLTELGRVFLRLRGKDAIRWLMVGELAQSVGPLDPWHAPRDLLQDAVAARGIVETSDEYGELQFPYSVDTLARLTSFGVLDALGHDVLGELQYRAAAAMRDVVQAVLDPGPWHTAVRALLDDDRALVVPGTAASAVEASSEQTKLIAHEVRNALIPVRHDIDALRSGALDPTQQRRLDDVRGGVVRVLAFVDELVQASEVITEPLSRCEIAALVDEALGWSAGGGRVTWQRPAGQLQVMAPRIRLARAISNILGNAIQATTASQPIRIAVIGEAGSVRVTVDDGGPGVAREDRTRIFQEGVTMRNDGAGSGFGLAFARRVVEGALQGRVWCEDSDLGGARFVIELPEASRE